MAQLSAHLRTYGASGSGDQNRLSLGERFDKVQVKLYAFSAQQIVNIHIANLGNAEFPGDNVCDGRHGTKADLGAFTYLDHAPKLSGAGRRHGDGNFFYLALLAHLGELLDGTENRYSVDMSALLDRIIINKTDNLVLDHGHPDDFS